MSRKISVRISAGLKDRTAREAERQGVSLSEYIKQAIDPKLAREGYRWTMS